MHTTEVQKLNYQYTPYTVEIIDTGQISSLTNKPDIIKGVHFDGCVPILINYYSTLEQKNVNAMWHMPYVAFAKIGIS